MPTYEYRCKSCGHELEVVQSFTEDALTVCPECDGPLKKVYGNVGISFKGSGFYKNDARGKGGAKTASSSSESSSTTSSSDGGSSSSDAKSSSKDTSSSSKATTAASTSSTSSKD